MDAFNFHEKSKCVDALNEIADALTRSSTKNPGDLNYL